MARHGGCRPMNPPGGRCRLASRQRPQRARAAGWMAACSGSWGLRSPPPICLLARTEHATRLRADSGTETARSLPVWLHRKDWKFATANDPKSQFEPSIDDSSKPTTVLQGHPTRSKAYLSADAEARISRLSENPSPRSTIEKPHLPIPKKPSARRTWSLRKTSGKSRAFPPILDRTRHP